LREHGTPILVVTDMRDHWRAALGFDPVERLRSEVPQAEVAAFESPAGHDVLARDGRNVARTVGDWLSARELI
jgi:hypothetical protein